MHEHFAVFGHGSLMWEPERADLVSRLEIARLGGLARCFNKRSGPRGCHLDESGWPHLDVPALFCEGQRCYSLAMGTEQVAGATLVGMVAWYPLARRDEVLQSLDRREGYDPNDTHQSSYRRETIEVELADRTARALIYLSNPGGRWHSQDLDLDTQARILLRATPARENPGHARGARYLFGVQRTLAAHGHADARIDALYERVRALMAARDQPK